MTRKKHSREGCENDGHSWQPGHRSLGAGQEEVPPWTQKYQSQQRLKQDRRQKVVISVMTIFKWVV